MRRWYPSEALKERRKAAPDGFRSTSSAADESATAVRPWSFIYQPNTLKIDCIVPVKDYNSHVFTSKIARIEKLAKKFPGRIAELDDIFDRTTNVYIDYANVRPWVSKLGWHIDLKRLK